MTAAALAPIAAALAANVADLHLRRIAHGAITPDHVLVDAAGVVRLCGFGRTLDATPAADVLAFGALLRSLLDDGDRSAAADGLRAAIDRCSVDDATARPTMAAIAASLARAPRRTVAAAPREPMRRRRWPIVVAIVAIAIVAVLLALPRRSRAEVHRDTLSTTTSTSLASWRASPRTLAGDGATWTFGDADGLRFVADWDCDGEKTPLLIDRSGAVWIVDEWPETDTVAARFVTRIDGVRDAHVDSMNVCADLVVETDDGPVTPALSA